MKTPSGTSQRFLFGYSDNHLYITLTDGPYWLYTMLKGYRAVTNAPTVLDVTCITY